MQDNKMYPTGYSPIGTRTTSLGATGTGDLSKFEIINLSSTAATAVNLINPVIGRVYYITQSGTGTENHVCTLTGCTIDDAGNNTLTLNAQGESIIMMCRTAIRYQLISNIGSVALSTV